MRGAKGRDVPHDMLFTLAVDAFRPEGKWMLSV